MGQEAMTETSRLYGDALCRSLGSVFLELCDYEWPALRFAWAEPKANMGW